MKSLMFTILVAMVACAIGLPSVVGFNAINKEVEKREPVRLHKFSFTNCLPESKQMAWVSNLEFLPDPLVFPGPLNVSFSVDVKAKLDVPLKAEVYLAKRVGSVFLKFPCIDQFGSCTYDDLCAMLSSIPACPPVFQANGIPCKCPFNQGNYTLPSSQFDVEETLFPTGDYHWQANLTINNNVVGCYNVQATFG